MNTKHTPGPWETTRQGYITYIWQSGTENSIGKVYADVNEDSEANARLIAAAPELLEALNAAYYVLMDGTLDANCDSYKRDARQKARAAIAKATQP